MKVSFKFQGGAADGKVIEIEDGIRRVCIPGIAGDSFLSHEYARTGLDLFTFVETKKGGSVAEARGRDLDYVFGFRDHITVLEEKIAAKDKALNVVNRAMATNDPIECLDILHDGASIIEAALLPHWLMR